MSAIKHTESENYLGYAGRLADGRSLCERTGKACAPSPGANTFQGARTALA